jgi:hypothetical protein
MYWLVNELCPVAVSLISCQSYVAVGPSVAVDWAVLLLQIQEVPGSNLNGAICYHN